MAICGPGGLIPIRRKQLLKVEAFSKKENPDPEHSGSPSSCLRCKWLYYATFRLLKTCKMWLNESLHHCAAFHFPICYSLTSAGCLWSWCTCRLTLLINSRPQLHLALSQKHAVRALMSTAWRHSRGCHNAHALLSPFISLLLHKTTP
jgi:hypothetical protein